MNEWMNAHNEFMFKTHFKRETQWPNEIWKKSWQSSNEWVQHYYQKAIHPYISIAFRIEQIICILFAPSRDSDWDTVHCYNTIYLLFTEQFAVQTLHYGIFSSCFFVLFIGLACLDASLLSLSALIFSLHYVCEFKKFKINWLSWY